MVPLAVEFLVRDIDRLDLFVSTLHAFRLEIAIDLAAYLEASFGRRHPMRAKFSISRVSANTDILRAGRAGIDLKPSFERIWPLALRDPERTFGMTCTSICRGLGV